MARRSRLDTELVRRGLAESREQAVALVAGGLVSIAGRPAVKPATAVAPDTPLTVRVGDEPTYASRGGHKLAGALDALDDPPVVVDRRCLDAGISTGGFTDVLLRRGAREVVGVDVGYGQVAWALRTDPRVRLLERTNVRSLRPEDVGEPLPELVVADLSFISLRLVLPALRSAAAPGADHFLLVKPQFEVGRDNVGRGGVVRDPALRAQAVEAVAASGADLGLGTVDVVRSPLPGPAGNVEFFLWLREGAPSVDASRIDAVVREEAE